MNNCPSFKVVFKDVGKLFEAAFVSDDVIKTNFGQIQPITEINNLYEGEYEVTPKMTEQMLPTKDRVLVKDVKIQPVPIFRVSNTSGGTTVYIANEV